MQKDAPKAGDTLATIKTNRGTMVAKLFVEQVPEGVKNFVELANAGKYTNVPFHRVISGFMIMIFEVIPFLRRMTPSSATATAR